MLLVLPVCICKPVHAVGKPVHAVGKPVHAVGKPVHAVGKPVHAVGKPVHAVGYKEVISGLVISLSVMGPSACLRASRVCQTTAICIVIHNASVSQCLQQSTVPPIEKEQGVKRPPTPSWL